MEGVDCHCGLKCEAKPPPPAGRPRARMQNIKQSPITHEFNYKQARIIISRRISSGGSTKPNKIYQSGAANFGQDLYLIVYFAGVDDAAIVASNRRDMWVAGAPSAASARARGLLDGDEAAASEHALVYAAMAATPQKLFGGEAVCGGLQVAVIEVLDSGYVGFFF